MKNKILNFINNKLPFWIIGGLLVLVSSLQGLSIHLAMKPNIREIHQINTIIQDIVDEKKWNEQILKSNHIGLWEWDLKSNTLKWNKGMLDIYCISRAEFLGTYGDWTNRVHPSDIKSAEQDLLTAINNRSEKYYYRFRVNHCGEWRWVVGLGSPIYDGNKEPLKVVGINFLEPDKLNFE